MHSTSISLYRHNLQERKKNNVYCNILAEEGSIKASIICSYFPSSQKSWTAVALLFRAWRTSRGNLMIHIQCTTLSDCRSL